MIEYVDHLHEHFVVPTVVQRGACRALTVPGKGGKGMEMDAASRTAFAWRISDAAQ